MEKEKQSTQYYDKNGCDKKREEIKEIKKQIAQLEVDKREALKSGDYSPVIREIDDEKVRLNTKLQYLYDTLGTPMMVTKSNDENVVDIDDVISVNLDSFTDVDDAVTFKLVVKSSPLESDFDEVSINSPLGKSVYKKRIGDTCHYNVDGTNHSAKIMSKVKTLTK